MTPKHIVSLELSKQLKEAGWKKETKFWWYHKSTTKPTHELVYSGEHDFEYAEGFYLPAPLATEILEEFKKSKNITIALFWDGKNWVCQDIDYTIKIPVF